jgi:serine/threonine-protein kinase
MKKIGNYRLIKKIGEGGFGYVYQAEHLLLGEKACLKQNINQTKEDAEMLKAEAKMLWRLCEYHSIPSTKDLIEIDKNLYMLVLDYIDGQTLEDLVKEKGRIHSEDVCWITERLLGALYYTYCNGVVHSDVKPGNMFVEPKKHDIKLIDFGLAAYKPKSYTRPAGYTPKFAAPELKNSQPPIPETDLYGAGMCMLYALGGDVAKKSLPNDVPDEIAEYCNRLIIHDPTKRLSWEKENPLEILSEVRMKVFKRKHMSD